MDRKFVVARGGIEPPTRGFSVRCRWFQGLNNQPLAALASPLPSHTKAHSWHTQSELDTFLAQSFAERRASQLALERCEISGKTERQLARPVTAADDRLLCRIEIKYTVAGRNRRRASPGQGKCSRSSYFPSPMVHEVLVVPDQPLMIHRATFPVADGHHAKRKAFARGRDRFAIERRHRLAEGARHDTGDRRPCAGAKANEMRLNLDVGGKDEQRLQVLDVPFDALGLMPVGPCHHDVRGVTFIEAIPFLIAEHVEIEGVEDLRFFST